MFTVCSAYILCIQYTGIYILMYILCIQYTGVYILMYILCIQYTGEGVFVIGLKLRHKTTKNGWRR